MALAVLCIPRMAAGKDYGYNSPSGRTIYKPNDTMASAVNSHARRFVIEVAAGAGPEGNLGLLLGALNQPFKGLEWFAGAGFEANPALHYTGGARYMMNFDGYRPYLGAGYLHVVLPALGTYSHNVFVETGYKWAFRRTYHVTLGVGVRRILHVGIRDGSVLHAPSVDPKLRDEQLASIYPWVPTVALRFSRAF